MVAGGSGGFGVIKVDKLKKVGLQSLLFGIHRCAPVKLQHWSANVVIITADTLTKILVYTDAVKELVLCSSVYWPN